MENKLLQTLQKVQKEMPIVNRNTQAFKYKYAPLDEVWDKISNILEDNGFVITNEIQEKGVLTVASHEFGELKSFIPFSTTELKPQDKGSEITYYRRYNLTAIFNVIVSGEDDDGTLSNIDSKTHLAPNNEPEPIQNFKEQMGIEDKGINGKCKLCGADLVTSKTGNLYCSKKCWIKK